MNKLERLERLIGEEKVKKINQQTVLVLGLGGVGSYAVESLVRSGINKIILVDYDVVDITNLNRQLMTNLENVGMLKTEVWKDRILSMYPECEVVLINEKITPDNIEMLFLDNPDYIVDACDTISTKKELILECCKRNIKLISCMGTGNKMDPTKLEIVDIRKTSYDPIAKILRKFIKEKKINKKVMVVCSKEKPSKVSNPIGSNAFVPGTAGLLCTSFIINDIVGDNNDTNSRTKDNM